MIQSSFLSLWNLPGNKFYDSFSLYNYKITLGYFYLVTLSKIFQSILQQSAKRGQVLLKIQEKPTIPFPDHTIVYLDLHYAISLGNMHSVITHFDYSIPLFKGVELVAIISHIISHYWVQDPRIKKNSCIYNQNFTIIPIIIISLKQNNVVVADSTPWFIFFRNRQYLLKFPFSLKL